MSTKPRAVRFSDEEENEIQKFIKLNPFLDFSTLARISIKQFINNPKLEFQTTSKNNIDNTKSETIKKHYQ